VIFKTKSFAEKFTPLTHAEIVAKKPYRKPVGNTGQYYKHNLMNAVNLVKFHHMSAHILGEMDKSASEEHLKSGTFDAASGLFIKGIVSLILLVYEVGENNKSFHLKSTMLGHYLKNVDEFWELFQELKDYDTRLFFLLHGLATWKLFQDRPWKAIGSSNSATGPRMPKLHPGLFSANGMNAKNCNQLPNTKPISQGNGNG
jgi:hypothetical protein